MFVCAANNASCDPRSDAAAPHSRSGGSDVVLQVQTLLQGRARPIRLHR